MTSINFSRPLLGLPGLTNFTLTQFDDTGALHTLTCTQAGGPQFFVANPQAFFPHYAPELPAEVSEELGGSELGATNFQVLVILTLGDTLARHTANLSAPILINPETGAALQVVLEDDQWSVRAPLVST